MRARDTSKAQNKREKASIMLKDIVAALKAAPADPIIGISERFQKDPRADKVNLTVGNYLGADGKIPLQPTVEEAQRRLLAAATVHSYLPMQGLEGYCRAVEEMAFGRAAEVLVSGRAATCQAVGGTGALYLGGVLAHETLGITHAAASDPTWGNHLALLRKAGLQVQTYAYYDRSAGALDVARMLSDIRALPARSLVLLQVCCHNPTGMDLTHDEWREVLEAVRAGDHLAMLDMAYQGFAEGLEEDAWPVRLFAESGLDFLLAVSLSKGFSLYGERVGALTFVAGDAREASVVRSLMRGHIRALYSNPPRWGAMIVETICSDAALHAAWVDEVDAMRERVRAMRTGLDAEARRLGVTLDFALRQHGIFSFTGFSAAEMERLRTEFGIYGIDSGRIAMAGLTEPVLAKVAQAFASIIKAR